MMAYVLTLVSRYIIVSYCFRIEEKGSIRKGRVRRKNRNKKRRNKLKYGLGSRNYAGVKVI